MRTLSARAVVLGGVDYGEADRVVHLLTEEGRVAAFAHGARKSKKRFGGALELFVTVQASLERARGRELRTLGSAEVLLPRLEIRSELSRIAIASYVVELADRSAPEGTQTASLLVLVEEALDWLAREPGRRAVRGAFELRLMCELGYEPNMGGCVVCGSPADPPRVDLSKGGLLCETHGEGAVLIGPNTFSWLAGVLKSGRFEPNGPLDATGADLAATKVGHTVKAFYDHLLGRPLKSEGMLRDLGL